MVPGGGHRSRTISRENPGILGPALDGPALDDRRGSLRPRLIMREGDFATFCLELIASLHRDHFHRDHLPHPPCGPLLALDDQLEGPCVRRQRLPVPLIGRDGDSIGKRGIELRQAKHDAVAVSTSNDDGRGQHRATKLVPAGTPARVSSSRTARPSYSPSGHGPMPDRGLTPSRFWARCFASYCSENV